MGFALPIDRWFRGPLRNWCEDLLSTNSLKGNGLLNIALIRDKWKQHLAGDHNWQEYLWNVVVFQDWLRHINSAQTSNRMLRTASGIAKC